MVSQPLAVLGEEIQWFFFRIPFRYTLKGGAVAIEHRIVTND